jgi:hypothetical protein
MIGLHCCARLSNADDVRVGLPRLLVSEGVEPAWNSSPGMRVVRRAIACSCGQQSATDFTS